jgi:hypothetical protein
MQTPAWQHGGVSFFSGLAACLCGEIYLQNGMKKVAEAGLVASAQRIHGRMDAFSW